MFAMAKYCLTTAVAALRLVAGLLSVEGLAIVDGPAVAVGPLKGGRLCGEAEV